ncbi:hypothetical protein A0H81_03220 [Grifola frondosa]|uniref:Uncharacterized protein n=1 Tax=Grifola frondosa TaxID=5627 RepID=A0A1C7MIR5_GRIFR|nr:hypothetical protein A0H81_03220 [Grifola frondosa]
MECLIILDYYWSYLFDPWVTQQQNVNTPCLLIVLCGEAASPVGSSWTIAWVLQVFLVSTVLGILLVLSAVRKYCSTCLSSANECPQLLQPIQHCTHTLFIILDLTWSPGEPQHYARGQRAGFGVMFGVILLGLLVIVLRRDIIWCVAASWICVSMWSLHPKPFPVFVNALQSCWRYTL